MRFVQFILNDHQCIGVRDGSNVVDLNGFCTALPRDLCTALSTCREQLFIEAKRAIASGNCRLSLGSIKLLPPITKPDKVLCVGNNYYDHCAALEMEVPKEPVMFNKFPSTITCTGSSITKPECTEKLDWEVELAIVIAKTAKDVTEDQAMNYVFGYTVANDLTARDLQYSKRNAGQLIMGKSHDNFCPLGPEIVTKEAIDDIHNLRLSTTINGVIKQDSNTSQLVFKPAAIIAHASRFFTLLPGDVILTGTPKGAGHFRKPPEYMKSGDTVTVKVDGIGEVTNTIL